MLVRLNSSLLAEAELLIHHKVASFVKQVHRPGDRKRGRKLLEPDDKILRERQHLLQVTGKRGGGRRIGRERFPQPDYYVT
jgi:hypothetical protein